MAVFNVVYIIATCIITAVYLLFMVRYIRQYRRLSKRMNEYMPLPKPDATSPPQSRPYVHYGNAPDPALITSVTLQSEIYDSIKNKPSALPSAAPYDAVERTKAYIGATTVLQRTCHNCGESLLPDAQFCILCGAEDKQSWQ